MLGIRLFVQGSSTPVLNETSVKKPQLPILFLLASFAQFSAVFFTPALPEIAASFDLSASLTQFSITTYLIGYAIGNLLYGPIANRYGRKKALYIGILIAFFGFLLTLLSGEVESFSLLITGRFITALGTASGIKITFTMIGDTYPLSHATKNISAIMYSLAITPALGIVLGGFLTHQFGWKSNFTFLSAYAIVILLISTRLPETLKEEHRAPLHFKKIKKQLVRQFANPIFILYSILMGFTTSFIYIFASEAPFVGITYIGLSSEVYGLLNFIPPLGTIIGATFMLQVAHKNKNPVLIKWGIVTILLGTLVMLGFFLWDYVTPFSLFAPMPLIYLGMCLVYTNASSLALSHAHDKSNGSAVMNFINISVAVCALLLLQVLPSDSPKILPLLFLFLGGCMWLLHLLTHKYSHV
ncbi:MAG: Bicyclomycin resistance protein [Chlamydiae bacterium]|nr:Bicyclomycin resistance protein [Chlamydiota bacterium]